MSAHPAQCALYPGRRQPAGLAAWRSLWDQVVAATVVTSLSLRDRLLTAGLPSRQVDHCSCRQARARQVQAVPCALRPPAPPAPVGTLGPVTWTLQLVPAMGEAACSESPRAMRLAVVPMQRLVRSTFWVVQPLAEPAAISTFEQAPRTLSRAAPYACALVHPRPATSLRERCFCPRPTPPPRRGRLARPQVQAGWR